MRKKLTLAARGSRLSLIQAALVQNEIEKLNIETEIKIVSTKGDQDRVSPLTVIGGDGLFVREIEKTLLSGEADVAIHPAKDLPFELEKDLVIGGVPAAGDPSDCILFREGMEIASDGRGLRIGTGSPRRIVQCRERMPDAEYVPIRGNVDTRIRKLREGAYDGIVLAKAGIDRLNPDLAGLTVESPDPAIFIPAPGQGIIAAECRIDDADTLRVLELIRHEGTWRRFMAERYLFGLLKGECKDAVGIYAPVMGEKISIYAMRGRKTAQTEGNYKDYAVLCDQIAEVLSDTDQ